tara:strand:+ start:242361 stop:242522 length:162 start_codon:yes stop_codon:yes gene_type:complete
VPNDPWGNPYIYLSRTPDHFLLQSLGRDGAEGGTGEDADILTSTDLADTPQAN